MTRVAVLGCGKMMGAVMEGALGFCKSAQLQVVTYTPSVVRARAMAAALGGKVAQSLADVPQSDCYLIGCKPQQFYELAECLRPQIEMLSRTGNAPAIVSVMAGITASQIEEALFSPNVTRVMPNTPIALGKGVSLLYSKPEVPDTSADFIRRFFGSCSEVVPVAREEDMEYLTGVSGCGPAYMFEYALSFVKPLVERGYDPDMAARLVLRTFEGAITLALHEQGHASLAQLRNNVTSSGGVTEQALNVMRAKGVPGAATAMLERAFSRNRELSGDALRAAGEPLQ